MKIIKYLILILLLVSPCFAATYYLDAVNGNDDNDGSSGSPWKTLSKAQSTVTSGDTVILRDGSYGDYIEYSVNRTDWVTYQADTDSTPILNRIFINWNGPSANQYLKFDGLTIAPSTGDYPISMQYAHHLQFLNLTVIGEGTGTTHRAFNARYSSDITIDGCTFSGGEETGRYDGFGYVIYTRDSENITITNNEITQFRGDGILAASTNTLIRGNTIHKFAGDAGIFFGGGTGGITIEDNEIYDIEVYEPNLTETPTTTTWSDDGTTMMNPNATWGVNAPFSWVTNIEIYIKSGTNVKTGDNEVRVLQVVSPTEIILDKSIKLDPNGPAPSNVDSFRGF